MFKFLGNLIAAVANKARSDVAFDEAMEFYDLKDYKQALPLLSEASELGNAEAMSLLGTMYLMGEGVKENGEKAEYWLQNSIEGGYEGAISVLGMAYATGAAGIKIDINKARELLSQSATQGDEQSVRMLSMIEKGEGMFKKFKKTPKRR
jgi:TPR repeat protein